MTWTPQVMGQEWSHIHHHLGSDNIVVSPLLDTEWLPEPDEPVLRQRREQDED